jgi:hypothetical protein
MSILSILATASLGRSMKMRRKPATRITSIIFSLACWGLYAQNPGAGPGAGAGASAKATAPADFTGQWISVVTEDWRYRMIVPKKGDYAGVPLSPLGRKLAENWDPARDEASGEQTERRIRVESFALLFPVI